jgi:hypothetical protein
VLAEEVGGFFPPFLASFKRLTRSSFSKQSSLLMPSPSKRFLISFIESFSILFGISGFTWFGSLAPLVDDSLGAYFDS